MVCPTHAARILPLSAISHVLHGGAVFTSEVFILKVRPNIARRKRRNAQWAECEKKDRKK